MKNNFLLSTWLWNRRHATRFRIPEGGVAIVLTDRAQYQKLIDGLADADIWSDANYSEVLTNHSTQILTN